MTAYMQGKSPAFKGDEATQCTNQ